MPDTRQPPNFNLIRHYVYQFSQAHNPKNWDEYVLDLIIQAEAAKAGITEEALLKQLACRGGLPYHNVPSDTFYRLSAKERVGILARNLASLSIESGAHRLQEHDIFLIGDLQGVGMADLLRKSGIGRRTVGLLNKALRGFGLELGADFHYQLPEAEK